MACSSLLVYMVECRLIVLDIYHIKHRGVEFVFYPIFNYETNMRHTYSINSHPLSEVEVEKDLGVMISHDLQSQPSSWYCCYEGKPGTWPTFEGIHQPDHYTVMKIYKQYVRLHLEYCIQAWSSWPKKDIDLLENVQQRAV